RVDDVLERIERFGAAAQEHFAAGAGQLEPHAVWRVLDGHFERDAHRRQRLFDEAARAPVHIHHLCSFAACADLPAPVLFNCRSAGGRTLCCGAGPINRFMSVCCPMPQRLLTVQYSTRPLGARISIAVNMMGMNIIIFCWTGSAT